jgi:hypothetical protein
LVTLPAHPAVKQHTFLIRQAALYTKDSLTFSDALALVR